MNMSIRTKIYIIAAVIAAVIIGGAAAWTGYRIQTLERAVEKAKGDGNSLQQEAIRKEADAAVFVEKIEYLERQIGELQNSARKQDEKLEKYNSNSRRARGDVDRARDTRTVPTDTTRLCEKLAELGHPC